MLDPGGIRLGKPKRCRIKGLVRKIREILEFLFSEPNLRRDKFLRQIVGSSGTMPVSILALLQFNRINELTQNLQILRRAAFESKILRLCDLEMKGDQGGICRRDPAPPPPRDILQKTVYLEGLPKDATVQWLKELLVALTHIQPAHISLPRQRTGQSRGFAFIEFGSYSQASNTVKDLNSKKAIATAFLLQSSRRKLFQSSLRQKQLKILESRPFDVTPLPPPSPQFMTRDERETFLAQKYTTSVAKTVTKIPMVTKEVAADKTKKRRRESESSQKSNGEPKSNKSRTRSKSKNPEKNVQDRVEARRKRKSTSDDEKGKLEGKIEAIIEYDQSNGRKRKRSRDCDKVQDNLVKKGKKEHTLGINKADSSEQNNTQLSETEDSGPQNGSPELHVPDLKAKGHHTGVTEQCPKLFRRARTNSFPPLSGHVSYHSWQYWTALYPNIIQADAGTVQTHNQQHEITVSHRDNEKVCSRAEKSTQTDSSYSQMMKKQWADKSLESKIDQLVKMGRNEAKKRKIPSTIHIPTKAPKKRRKSRVRKKKHNQLLTRRRRNSSIIIPNWGGLRLKAILGSEWSQFKKKYKEIQTQNMRKLKQSLKDSTFLFAGAALRKHIKYDEYLANTSDNEDDDDSCTEMENDFNLPETNSRFKPVTDPRGSRRVGQAPIYRPGVIVKIQSDSDLPSHVVLRHRFSEYGCVAYVDRLNSKSGFIRFNNQSGAQRSIEKEDFYHLSLLTGRKEEEYWESLLNKREAKRSSERKKLRGVERLVKKAVKQKAKERKLHILFDNDLIKEI